MITFFTSISISLLFVPLHICFVYAVSFITAIMPPSINKPLYRTKLLFCFGLKTCVVSKLRKHRFMFDPNILNFICVHRFTHLWVLHFFQCIVFLNFCYKCTYKSHNIVFLFFKRISYCYYFIGIYFNNF